MADIRRKRKSRRGFLKTVPAVVGAGLALPAATAGQAPSGIDKETIACAARISGVEFGDADRDLMRPLVDQNHENYEAIRKVPVGYEVEPAFTFRPVRRNPLPPTKPSIAAHNAAATPAVDRPGDEALPFMTVPQIAALVRSRKMTSAELTELYLSRLKRFGPRLECVVTLTEDLARAQAAAADQEIRAGRYRGPLHGLPYGIKDLFATKGIRTTWGAKPYVDRVPSIDAAAVERMHNAGAVLVAKLTSGELAIGDVWYGGRTRNPWDPTRGSSGSSAGPAAATAAGLVAFAIGTETGGSIMSPAHTCGVVGVRPTYGRVSRYGCMTLRWTMDKVGPLARGVEDCALVLEALVGADDRDETASDASFPWSGARPLSDLKIGVLEADFNGTSGDEEERRGWQARKPVLDAALETLRRAGARLSPIELPDLPARALYAVLNAEAGAAFDDLVRSGRVAELAGKGPNDRANQLRASRVIPAVEYIRAQRVRRLLGERMEAVMSSVDLFVAPTTSASVTLANLTGHPAVTVNAGFGEGLPVGLMFTGRLYDEATLLGAALSYERARGAQPERPRLQT